MIDFQAERSPALVGAVAAAGLVAVLGAIAYAAVNGDFSRDAARLMTNPWGVATLVDVYVGLTLFGALVFWRERHPLAGLAWLVLFYSLGNVATTLYVLIALRGMRVPRAVSARTGACDD